jgi:hypothetical protein
MLSAAAMETLQEKLEEMLVDGTSRRCTCGRAHNGTPPGRVTKIIPPSDPRDYGWWEQWRVELRPDGQTELTLKRRLTTYIDVKDLQALFKRHSDGSG